MKLEDVAHIAYTPLDIPKIEPDDWNKFWEIWNSKKQQVVKKDTGYGEPKIKEVTTAAPWIGMNCYLVPQLSNDSKNFLLDYGQYHDFSKEFPKMWAGFQQLPFKTINSIRLVSNNMEVIPHHDGVTTTGTTFLVRVMIWDENPSPTLYLCESNDEIRQSVFVKPDSPYINNTRMYMQLPKDSNSFVFNNVSCFHGAEHDGKNNKILAMISGVIDEDRYFDMIHSSSEKYKDYVHVVK